MSRTFRNSATVVLGDDGSGVVRIAPSARNWTVNYLTVKCSSHVLESRCYVYDNYEGDTYLIDASFTGSSGDTTDTVMQVSDGNALLVKWVAGDPGATATVTWSGEEY